MVVTVTHNNSYQIAPFSVPKHFWNVAEPPCLKVQRISRDADHMNNNVNCYNILLHVENKALA